jgi:hypothetical protein
MKSCRSSSVAAPETQPSCRWMPAISAVSQLHAGRCPIWRLSSCARGSGASRLSIGLHLRRSQVCCAFQEQPTPGGPTHIPDPEIPPDAPGTSTRVDLDAADAGLPGTQKPTSCTPQGFELGPALPPDDASAPAHGRWSSTQDSDGDLRNMDDEEEGDSEWAGVLPVTQEADDDFDDLPLVDDEYLTNELGFTPQQVMSHIYSPYLKVPLVHADSVPHT